MESVVQLKSVVAEAASAVSRARAFSTTRGFGSRSNFAAWLCRDARVFNRKYNRLSARRRAAAMRAWYALISDSGQIHLRRCHIESFRCGSKLTRRTLLYDATLLAMAAATGRPSPPSIRLNLLSKQFLAPSRPRSWVSLSRMSTSCVISSAQSKLTGIAGRWKPW